MMPYNNILLLIQNEVGKAALVKANLMAEAFGARLCIGYVFPEIPVIQQGAVNIESELIDLFREKLEEIGYRYMIPKEDQWIVSYDDAKLIEQLKKSGIDLILLDNGEDTKLSYYHLATKIIKNFSCSFQFINN